MTFHTESTDTHKTQLFLNLGLHFSAAIAPLNGLPVSVG
jgi:hypothetical protein